MQALLIDRDKQLRHAVSWILCDLGFSHIVEAADGDEALCRLAGNTFDLVITDCRQSRIGDSTLQQALRVRGIQAPVIMLQGEANRLDGRACSIAIHKPLNADELRHAIERCMPAVAV